jgi:hypothetical protein
MTSLTKDELESAAAVISVRPIGEHSVDALRRLMTVTQYVTDLCLNEIEDRGELTFMPDDGRVIVPYHSNYMIDTILTRASRKDRPGNLRTVKGRWRTRSASPD